jgi:signal transduction histidine kinase/diadenosine tetraphosphate (Ap4A) HIT family hydrolase
MPHTIGEHGCSPRSDAIERVQFDGSNLAADRVDLALLKAGALQKAIFNSANFSSIATDAKGVIQIFNVGAERMLGYAAIEVMNRITPADISDPEEVIARARELSAELGTPIAPGFEALVFKASRGIEDIYELTYIRKDGSRFPAVVSVTALRDAQDAIIGYLLIGTDNTARKLAEAALLKAGALQRAIFDSANFSSIATDAKGVIQIFNVGAERMLGYGAVEVMNRITPADISDPEEVIARAKELSAELGTPITPGFEALVFKASRGIEDIYELTYIRKDGSRFPAVVSVTALRDAQDAIIGYLLIGTDNTARKLAEAALLKAGALQKAIFNSANFSSIATDAKGVIQIFNVGAERMLGYAAIEVMNRITPADISDPEEVIARARELSAELGTPIAPGFEALVFKASRGIEDIYELTYIRKDGSRFPAVVSVTALRDAQDAIIGYLLIGTDNTARKLAEAALLKAGALQRAIFDSANFSSIATDAKGVIQIFNVGAEHMLGYGAVEVMNRITPADISDPEEVIARAKALSAELGTAITPGFEALVFKASRGIEDIYELTYIRKDGSRFPAVVSVTALRDAQETIIGYLLIGTDNTARRQMALALAETEAELRRQAGELETLNAKLAQANSDLERENAERRRAEIEVRALNEGLESRVVARTAEIAAVNRDLETFAYSVSHDLRAPLRHMTGFSQVLLEDYGDVLDETATDFLHRITRASVHMGQLIDGLLALSRVSRGDLERTDIDLSAMVQNIAQKFRLAEPDRKVGVAIAPRLHVRADVRMMFLVLQNLFGNAWKFTAKTPDPEIAFGATEHDGGMVYFVRDNGAGFDMTYVDKLFAPFQRLHTTSEFEGTGIGLATVARIIHRHGGNVWIDSAVGKGTTVYFAV